MSQIQAVKVVNDAGAAADSRGEPGRLNPHRGARRLRDRDRQPVHQVIHHSIGLPPGSNLGRLSRRFRRSLSHIT